MTDADPSPSWSRRQFQGMTRGNTLPADPKGVTEMVTEIKERLGGFRYVIRSPIQDRNYPRLILHSTRIL